MDRKEIKREAKEIAFRNKWNLWKPALIIALVVTIVEAIAVCFGIAPKYEWVMDETLGFKILENTNPSIIYDIIDFALSLALIPASIGLISYVLKLVRGEKVELSELLSKFKYIVPIIIVELAIGLLGIIWSLLLIIPGIIFVLKMAMAEFIIADEVNENIKAKYVMDKSTKMMDGHKWEFFVFELSFIGWYFLCGLTFGIAAIWAVPYIQVAHALYYEKLKAIA